MMKNKIDLFTQFGKMKDHFKEIPRDQLWDKLEEKLNNKKNVRKLQFYRLTSFAAVFIALIAAVLFLNHYLNEHNPKLFVSNEGFTSLVLEDLVNSNESFINTESISLIRQAYAKAEEPNVLAQLPGSYSNLNSGIKFKISIQNYSYILEFETIKRAAYVLNDIEDYKILFRTSGGDFLTFEKEGSELIMMESNEYNSELSFRKVSEI